MLGFFPNPYPDESLYSIIARLRELQGAIGQSLFSTQVFLKKGLHWGLTGVPTGFDKLFIQLPTNHHFSKYEFIYNHTLTPLFEPFLPPHRTIWKDNGEAFIGCPFNNLFLKYCPFCAQQDKSTYGEAYWHRLHQAPGVLICQKHNAMLINTPLSSSGTIKLITLSEYIKQNGLSSTERINSNNANHAHLLNIVEDVDWLLHNPQKAQELSSFRNKVKALFINTQWISKTGHRIKQNEFLTSFKNFYSQELLQKFDCYFNGNRSSWFPVLFQNRTKYHSQHPLRYILLYRFFNWSAKSFFMSFELPASNNPFGPGPWPCLNKLSSHFNIRTISEVIWDNKKSDPLGSFKCPICGYTYIFRASSPEKIIVRQYGYIWEKRLLEMVNKDHISIRKVSKMLDLDHSTISRRIQKLTSRKLDTDIETKAEKQKQWVEQNRKERRKIWNRNRREHPDANTSSLAKMYPGNYAWLLNNDRAWLYANRPPRKKMDWEAKDKELLCSVKETVPLMLNSPNYPIKLTNTSILRNIGLKTIPKKIPKTKEYIDTVVETFEEYSIRRLIWSSNQYIKDGNIPTRTELCRRARLSLSWRTKLTAIVDSQIKIITSTINNNGIIHSHTVNDFNYF